MGQISQDDLSPKFSKKIDNTWQKGTYNDTNIANLGAYNTEKTLMVNQSDWKNTGNVEQLDIIIPMDGSFSGIIKATYSSTWGNTSAYGGAEVIYSIGTFKENGIKLNDFTITSANSSFTESYKILQPYIDFPSGNIALLILRSPTANNPFHIKLEIQGYAHHKSLFTVTKEISFAVYDKESKDYGGYPWTPQASQIPTYSAIGRWDAGYDTYTRFQGNCTLITDWNLATQNGMYMGSNALNAPNTDWYMGTVTVHHDGWILQRITNFNNTKKEYQRYKSNGIWGDWELVYEVGDKAKLDIKRDIVAYDKSTGTYPDPNTYGDATFITNHANMGDSQQRFWFVEQVFYNGTSNSTNRSQFARTYNGGTADMKSRHCYNNVWSAWSPSNQELFQSVSNGKSLIANAITQIGTSTSATAEFATMANNITTTVTTGKTQIANAIINKGVSASASSSFATLASNISNIPTGTKVAKGAVYFPAMGGGSQATAYIYNIPFKPMYGGIRVQGARYFNGILVGNNVPSTFSVMTMSLSGSGTNYTVSVTLLNQSSISFPANNYEYQFTE